MFCGECGTKNKKSDLFCENCGHKLEHEEEKNTKTTKKSSKEEQKEVQPTKKVATDNKSKTKVIVIIILIVALGIGYKIGSDLTSPEKIVEGFIDAEIDKDSDKLYQYFDIEGDKTFASKKILKKIADEDDSTVDINNYKVTGVEYGKGKLTAKVKFSYTTKNSSKESTSSISLVKQKTKKYIIFDDWKIDNSLSDSLLIKDFSIQIPKKAKLVYFDIEVKDKYLSKKESTSTKDVYVLPQVFVAKTPIKVTLENGTVIEKEFTPSSYSKTYKLNYDKSSITDKEKKEIVSKSKKIFDDLYSNAILEKKYDDIKSNYPKVSKDFEDKYDKFISNLKKGSNKLKSFSTTSLDIYDLSLTDEGNLKVKFKVNYKYKVEYTSYSDEVKTSENSDYSYMTLVLAKDKKSYSLVEFDNLKTYFYK